MAFPGGTPELRWEIGVAHPQSREAKVLMFVDGVQGEVWIDEGVLRSGSVRPSIV